MRDYTINNKFNPFLFKRILRDYTCSSYLKKSINWFWFSGFIQAKGSLTIQDDVKCSLYISQPIASIQILYKIKTFIGYGYVRIDSSEALYVLQHNLGLKLVLNNLCPL